MNPLTSRDSKHMLRRIVSKLSVLCVLLLLVQNTAYSQNDSNTPLGLKAGKLSGSYELTNIDSVNLFSGRVTVQIPRDVLAGRGQAGTRFYWRWDSPMRWQVYKSQDPWGNPVYGAGFGGGSPWASLYGAGEHKVYPLGTGWGGPTQCDIDGFIWAWDKTLTRFMWEEPDGTEHEMRDVLTNGQPLAGSGCSSAGRDIP